MSSGQSIGMLAIVTTIASSMYTPAASQVTVPGGTGKIAVVFGLTPASAQKNGPIQVNLTGDERQPTSLVIIGPRCEVAMAHGSIAIGPIDKQMTLSGKIGSGKGMPLVIAYARQVGLQLSPQELECGGRILDQAARGESLKLDFGG